LPPERAYPTLLDELEPRRPIPAALDDGVGEARAELMHLSRSLRAHLEVLQSSGAWGVPKGPTHNPSVRVPEARPEPATATEPASAALEAPIIGPTEATRLAVLANEARLCTKCALHASRTQSVFSRGTGVSGLAFIGEGPGEEEDRSGQPFVGPAGQLLDKMIAAMQLARDDVYVCNIVKCRPPKNRKPELDEMSRCMPFLSEQLAIIKPRVIVALGATAVQGLLGTTEGITRLRGQWKLYRGNIPVMPTFHPAYLLRQPQAKREVWKDLQEALRQLGTRKPGEAAPG
jgi:uracil-DNA glycosylase